MFEKLSINSLPKIEWVLFCFTFVNGLGSLTESDTCQDEIEGNYSPIFLLDTINHNQRTIKFCSSLKNFLEKFRWELREVVNNFILKYFIVPLRMKECWVNWDYVGWIVICYTRRPFFLCFRKFWGSTRTWHALDWFFFPQFLLTNNRTTS